MRYKNAWTIHWWNEICSFLAFGPFCDFYMKPRSLRIIFCKTLPEFVCPRKNFREGFSDDELERLLSQPDITSAVGKRDYAMMVLAVQSGLRSCDIIRLTFDCINWRTREIRVVQHKTGQPIVIPLEPETGNAIADYLLNGRPKSSLPQIFLCHVGAVRALKSRTGSAIVSKYMKGANSFRVSRISQFPAHLRYKSAPERSAN